MSEFVTAARPYARAIFELASAEGSLEKWSGQLALMVAVAEDPDMQGLLENPKMSKEGSGEIVAGVCGEHIDAQAGNLVRLMAENGRLPLLPEVAAMFEVLRSEAEGTIEAEVVSAYKVGKAQENAIANALKARLGRDVKLTTRIDKSLLGGAIIRAGDLVIDGSLKSRLEKMSGMLAR